MTYQLHPLCTLFPRMEGAEFAALRADIKANGLRAPIMLHGGMILDGGNRYRACIEAGVQPVFEEFDGGNLVSFVLSANLHRRHMSAGQQAAIVASATDWGKAQRRGGDGSNQHKSKPEGPPVCSPPLETVAQRAAVSGANERTQREADKLVKEHPKLAKQVTQGKKSLYRAVQEAKPTPKPAAAPPQDARDELDPIAEWEATQKELEKAQAVIASLEADDVKAELVKQVRIRQGIEARLSDEMEKSKGLARQLDNYGKWYAELRKITGLEERSAITRYVREAKNAKESAL